jgi:hypothetical protein
MIAKTWMLTVATIALWSAANPAVAQNRPKTLNTIAGKRITDVTDLNAKVSAADLVLKGRGAGGRAGGSATTNAPPSAPKTPALTLISLECFRTNDDSPKTDEIELRVYFSDGRSTKFSGTMNRLQNKDQALVLPKHVQGPHRIAGDIRVELWDIDKGLFEKDDKLGWFVVRPGDSLGRKHVTLKNGAHYVLHFQVSQ